MIGKTLRIYFLLPNQILKPGARKTTSKIVVFAFEISKNLLIYFKDDESILGWQINELIDKSTERQSNGAVQEYIYY